MTKLDPLDEVLQDLVAGKIIILIDDVHRENEGDLVMLSQLVTADNLAFMMTKGRGLICITVALERASALGLPLQSALNLSSFDTPFAVSVDDVECASRGVEAGARAQTIRRLISQEARPEDFVSPGSVYPLIAHPKGVLGRRGQTEGSYDLARIVGGEPSGVICEILNADGTMARGEQLTRFAAEHGLKITSVEEVLQYRIKHEPFFQQTAVHDRVIAGEPFKVYVIEDDLEGKEHLFLVYSRHKDSAARPLVRIHSECLTGDVFGSQRCDCGEQLDHALQAIIKHGYGIVAYLRQEGRGIGLANKIKAYRLQDAGLDTIDANLELGFDIDLRDYRLAAKVLKALGVTEMDLMTNNPDKLQAMKNAGFTSVQRVPLVSKVHAFNESYLKTKKQRMGHIL